MKRLLKGADYLQLAMTASADGTQRQRGLAYGHIPRRHIQPLVFLLTLLTKKSIMADLQCCRFFNASRLSQASYPSSHLTWSSRPSPTRLAPTQPQHVHRVRILRRLGFSNLLLADLRYDSWTLFQAHRFAKKLDCV